MEEFMYLGLRKVEGVSRTDFQNYFGKNVNDVYGKVLDKLEEEKLLEFSGDRIRLTHRGMDGGVLVLKAENQNCAKSTKNSHEIC